MGFFEERLDSGPLEGGIGRIRIAEISISLRAAKVRANEDDLPRPGSLPRIVDKSMPSIVYNHKVLPPVITFMLLYNLDGFAHEFEVSILPGDEPALCSKSILHEYFL